MVRHGQREAEQVEDRGNQNVSLLIGQMENGAQRQCRQDRRGRIEGMAALYHFPVGI
jgi:hypothetical protein